MCQLTRSVHVSVMPCLCTGTCPEKSFGLTPRLVMKVQPVNIRPYKLGLLGTYNYFDNVRAVRLKNNFPITLSMCMEFCLETNNPFSRELKYYFCNGHPGSADPVNQQMLIDRLEAKYGITESVLGPIFSTIYTSPISNVINTFGLLFHQYADDTSSSERLFQFDRKSVYGVKLTFFTKWLACHHLTTISYQTFKETIKALLVYPGLRKRQKSSIPQALLKLCIGSRAGIRQLYCEPIGTSLTLTGHLFSLYNRTNLLSKLICHGVVHVTGFYCIRTHANKDNGTCVCIPELPENIELKSSKNTDHMIATNCKNYESISIGNNYW
ncbi:hypothetical protein HELRODRAFT_184070 [Helobdella robusta]|uniref:Uncharacterized protein n=1 Tax=Helobdella robusta TaxID=6412 RepID=T1FKI9_HELRO|nr:hypothetical protein HELRODRAFT_184070 [Helobdella robusta]ESO08294.1 hypothetical protein HELRODRAFT_184070 [Helobdella robusta]